MMPPTSFAATSPATVITTFYQAFQRLDGDAMAACYSPEASFSDPLFGQLNGAEIGAMWRMLCAKAQDFRVDFRLLHSDATGGTVQWTAHYTFGPQRRAVVNRVHAQLRVMEGRITVHHDHFNTWSWARQALGLKGWLLGWSRPVQQAVQQQARHNLAAFRRQL